MKAHCNLGHHERMIRITVGLVFLALSGFTTLPTWGDLVLMIVGLIALLTGIIGYCPAWHGMRINTYKGDPRHADSQTHSGPPQHHAPTTHQ